MAANSPRVIVALDYCDEISVFNLVDRLTPAMCRLKVGKELFTACGPELVRKLVARGFDVFLDLKFHDIPNTVAQALKAARDLGVWMTNVHASGGVRMLEAARAALSGKDDPLLIAVTVLTSMDEKDLQQTGVVAPLQDHILHLAQLSASAGLDGVVCSAREAQLISSRFGRDFCLVTPGIRPADSEIGDQRRVVTPEEALILGSHYLVIGRPVTHAPDPCTALGDINKNISGVVERL
ncbi:MAG TPA: orotidine-5'-phosphate decarboxylase [Pseudomonadales bacterium]|nr:orotidine-5'-phosphate decarboxylase [Pseudomonadales bacterium]